MNGMPSFADAANLEPGVDPDAIEVPADASPLDFMQAVYRSPSQPMHRRLKAAIECAGYLHPKLSVTAQVNSEDFAAALDRANKRSAKAMKMVEPPKIIEQTPQATVRGPVPDHLFRRA